MVYPPALAQLEETRDESLKNVIGGKNVRESFHDFVAINRTLGEESRTKEAFVQLHARSADAAKKVFELALPALIKAKEYKLCGKYVDPKATFPRMIMIFRENKRLAKNPRFGARELEVGKKIFANRAATLVAILVVNARKAEAEEIARRAKKECDDAWFQSEIDEALQGNVPKPWP